MSPVLASTAASNAAASSGARSTVFVATSSSSSNHSQSAAQLQQLPRAQQLRRQRSIDGQNSRHQRRGSRRGPNQAHKRTSGAHESARKSSITAINTSSSYVSGNNNNNNNNEGDDLAHKQQQQPSDRFSEKRTSMQSNMSTNSLSSSLSSTTTMSSSNAKTCADGQSTSSMSNIEYENLRNTTLLYFLDRLYRESRDGKEARTLHELSCLFGTKEFTKEMRQVVGASRNGLKKFLESYPSLFTIEDDKVYVTQLKQDAQKPTRDYDKEACDYFAEKLKQFGTPFVPIKNLFGYRSQASQEIRHVSGRNARDFKQFLMNNSHVFEVLVDEHVVLKSSLKELESAGQSDAIDSLREQQNLQDEQDNVMIDPYLNKRFAHLVENCLKRMQLETDASSGEDESTKFELRELHERIKQDCNNQLFLKMVKTIDDLRVFLRMHPKLFKRAKSEQEPDKDFVSLLTEEERNEMIKAQSFSAQRLLRQHSTLGNNIEESGFMSLQPSVEKQVTEQIAKEQKQQPPDLTSIEKVKLTLSSSSSLSLQETSIVEQEEPNPVESADRQKQHSNDRFDLKQQQKDTTQPQTSIKPTSTSPSQLRSTAPPFVPAQYKTDQSRANLRIDNFNGADLSSHAATRPVAFQHTYHTTLPQQASQPLQRSMSSLTSGARIANDSRQALRNYLLKASEINNSNVGSNHHNGNARLNGSVNNKRQYPTSSNMQSSSSQSQAGLMSANGFVNHGDDLRARTVDIVCEASNIISHIMNTTDAIAFDCKGYNLGSDGQITLIQLGYLPSNDTSDYNLGKDLRQLSYTNGNDNAHKVTTSNSNDESAEKKNIAPKKPEVCVFDLITNPELAHCLKPLLESDKIIKIAHDVRNKSNALYSRFKIVLKNVFDTQVANLVIQQQETGRPAYKSRYISISKLCELYGNEDLLNYRELIKVKTKSINGGSPVNGYQRSGSNVNDKGVNYWRSRPLTKAMIFSATVDVYCLIGGIYHNLKSKIKPEYEPLFEQLNYENVLARIKPDEIKSVKNERKIDLEVIDLKRKLYSDTKSLIVLSNREIRLLRHIELTPEVRQKIQQCKKVAKKLERLDMKAQMLESLTSQLATTDQETTGDPNQTSLDRTTANNVTDEQLSSLSSSSAHMLSQNESTNNLKTPVADDAEFSEARLSNLMDGSMFDELKDKMIESSSLLESLEDDDDDDDFNGGRHGSHNHKYHNHTDCCNCLCHHRGPTNTSSGETAQKVADATKTTETVPDSTSESSPKSTKEESSTTTTTTTTNAATYSDITPNTTTLTTTNGNNDIVKTMSKTSVETTTTIAQESPPVDASKEIAGSGSAKAVDMAVQCDLLG